MPNLTVASKNINRIYSIERQSWIMIHVYCLPYNKLWWHRMNETCVENSSFLIFLFSSSSSKNFFFSLCFFPFHLCFSLIVKFKMKTTHKTVQENGFYAFPLLVSDLRRLPNRSQQRAKGNVVEWMTFIYWLFSCDSSPLIAVDMILFSLTKHQWRQ